MFLIRLESMVKRLCNCASILYVDHHSCEPCTPKRWLCGRSGSLALVMSLTEVMTSLLGSCLQYGQHLVVEPSWIR